MVASWTSRHKIDAKSLALGVELTSTDTPTDGALFAFEESAESAALNSFTTDVGKARC